MYSPPHWVPGPVFLAPSNTALSVQFKCSTATAIARYVNVLKSVWGRVLQACLSSCGRVQIADHGPHSMGGAGGNVIGLSKISCEHATALPLRCLYGQPFAPPFASAISHGATVEPVCHHCQTRSSPGLHYFASCSIGRPRDQAACMT